MKETYILSDNILSPLGTTTEEHYANMRNGQTGVQQTTLLNESFYLSKMEDTVINLLFESIGDPIHYTKTEKLLLISIRDALKKAPKLDTEKTLLIISTTKGNIDLLDTTLKSNFPEERVHLWSLAKTIQKKLKLTHTPHVISNACISGVNSLIVAHRLIQDGSYTNIIVSGVDIISNFVVSGFQSFKALSASHCKPFDKNRDGINLGEACGTIILSSNKHSSTLKLMGGAISNDANHISGPSRTGDGLYIAISKTLQEAAVDPSEISFINAHGTATLYNDEMESKAFTSAQLNQKPLNSLKGYFGHTLGAAGVIETIISYRSLLQNEVLPTKGFETLGVPEEVYVSKNILQQPGHYLLKTASGFGGGNAALVIENTTSTLTLI